MSINKLNYQFMTLKLYKKKLDIGFNNVKPPLLLSLLFSGSNFSQHLNLFMYDLTSNLTMGNVPLNFIFGLWALQ